MNESKVSRSTSLKIFMDSANFYEPLPRDDCLYFDAKQPEELQKKKKREERAEDTETRTQAASVSADVDNEFRSAFYRPLRFRQKLLDRCENDPLMWLNNANRLKCIWPCRIFRESLGQENKTYIEVKH